LAGSFFYAKLDDAEEPGRGPQVDPRLPCPRPGGYVGSVVVGGVLLIACALALAWPTLRVIRAPGERWVQGRSQWLLFIWARRGEAAPSASELRLWASIWLGVATILLGLGIALIASA